MKEMLLIFSGVTLLAVAGGFNHSLAAWREPPTAVHLELSHGKSAAAGPVLAVVMLGGLRSLVADLLWLRASDLQDEGRYFELVQLADWITVLEPRFKQVWAIQAWNLAYNISVMMPDEQERWRWIEQGIKLLRDRGIPANAADPYLYSELGFIFFNKVGNPGDPSLQYLKRIWADRMRPMLGEGGKADYERIAREPRLRASLGQYGLVPDKMREVERKYGPLDWRVPQTHSLYWAWLGNTATGTNIHNAACDRMIYDSMAALFDYGKLTYTNGIMVTSVNFDALPQAMEAYEDAIAHSDSDLPQTAYSNFLGSATRTLKFYHHDKEARRVFDKLRTRFPSADTEKGFDEFVRHARPRLPQIIEPPDEHL